MGSEVKVTVSLASGAVQTGLTKIRAQFSQFRHELSGEIGSFLALGGMVRGLESIIEKATKIANISKRFAVPPKELQRVGNAAKDVAELEDVARSWNKLAVNQQKAIEGNEEMRKAFEKLGIPMEDVAKMTVDQLFYRIADATATAEDRGKAYAAVVQIMGRNAGQLYSTLEKGSGLIKKQGDEMGIMADGTIEKLHKMHLAIERLKQTLFIYGGGIVMFFSNIVESVGAMAGEAVNEAEALVGVFMASASTIKNFLKNALHGNFSVDTTELKAAIATAVEARKGMRKDLADIWSKKPEEHVDPKKPLDAEIEPTHSEVSKAEKLVTLREQLAEIQRKTANAELTIQEKINALVAQRAALLKEAASTKDEEKKLQLEIDAAKVTDEINTAIKERTRYIQQAKDEADKEEEDRKKKEGEAPSIAATSLRRIGGQQTGGTSVSGVTNDLLREQTAHRKILTDIEKNTRNSGGPLLMK